MVKVIIAVCIGAVIMIAIFSRLDFATSINDPNTTDTSGSDTSIAGKNTLTISGEVVKPGTYAINEGGTLSDLITAAGGVTSNADDKAYNLDYLLTNNLSFYIAPLFDQTDICSDIPIAKVNVNSATDTELITLNGVSSKIATNIIEYRNSHGEFKRIEDLKNVSQIGSTTFEKIKKNVTLK